MKKTIFSVLLASLALTASAQFGRNPDTNPDKGYKDTYQGYFTVGVAVNMRNINDPQTVEIIKKNYNSITAENDMKPGELHPQEGVWRWQNADAIANFCRQNGIKLRGHCLVWHSQFANWMFNDKNGKPVTKEVFYQRLREHIHTVVNRYKDVVYAWDVVNEAMSDAGAARFGQQPNPYRETQLYRLCGDEFIAKAFEYAHEADPNAILFYNDYNAFQPAKRPHLQHGEEDAGCWRANHWYRHAGALQLIWSRRGRGGSRHQEVLSGLSGNIPHHHDRQNLLSLQYVDYEKGDFSGILQLAVSADV